MSSTVKLKEVSDNDMQQNTTELKRELDEIEESVSQALLDDEHQDTSPAIATHSQNGMLSPSETETLSGDEKNDGSITRDDSILALRNVQETRMHPENKKTKKSVKSYYENQDTVIQSFVDTSDLVENSDSSVDDELEKRITRAVRLSMICNVLLLAAKSVAVYLSGSISIISSLIDSAIDLVSGIIIWVSARAIKKSDVYKYPVGKRRLEPLAILVLSSIMAVCAMQIIVESVDRIIQKATVTMEIGSIIVMCATIVTKFFLFLFCHRIHSPSTDALALDHRNDVLSNLVALGCGLIATYYWRYADPVGAILISLYIAYNWYQTGAVQIKQLAGKTAPPEFLQQITWICLHHDDRIAKIDTVRGFHIGYHYIVEVHIVLAEEMTLKEAHNIGESLQCKIERLHSVERAFVHLDYEFDHNPSIEHKAL